MRCTLVITIKFSTSKTCFTNIFVSIMFESLLSQKTLIFEFSHSNLHTKSSRNQQLFVRLFRLFRNLLRLFSLQHHEVKYSQRKCFRDLFHTKIRISQLRDSKLHQNRWRNYQSIVHLFFHLHLFELLFENIKNVMCKNHISLWMIWVAYLLKSLNHLICDRIKIVRSIFRKISTFVNLRSRVSQLFRKSFISLSRICSRCSMRNLKKRTCFKVKRTFLFENFFQNNRELQSISSLQSIKNRRLIKIWKTQNRKVWINTCLRNRFASFSIKIFLRNRSIYYINCQVFSVIWSFQSLVLLQKFLFSFSYFFVFSQSFSLFSRSFRSCQLQKWVALTFTNKSFRSLIVSFNKSNRFVASKRSW